MKKTMVNVINNENTTAWKKPSILALQDMPEKNDHPFYLRLFKPE